jgi:hypothetical protein
MLKKIQSTYGYAPEQQHYDINGHDHTFRYDEDNNTITPTFYAPSGGYPIGPLHVENPDSFMLEDHALCEVMLDHFAETYPTLAEEFRQHLAKFIRHHFKDSDNEVERSLYRKVRAIQLSAFITSKWEVSQATGVSFREMDSQDFAYNGC